MTRFWRRAAEEKGKPLPEEKQLQVESLVDEAARLSGRLQVTVRKITSLLEEGGRT